MTTLAPAATRLPCLSCGRALPTTWDGALTIACTCGARYSLDLIQEALAPGAWRLWLRVLACACPGTIRRPNGDITVTAHMCPTSQGHVPIGTTLTRSPA